MESRPTATNHGHEQRIPGEPLPGSAANWTGQRASRSLLTIASSMGFGFTWPRTPPVPWNRSAWVGVPAVAHWLTNATSIHEDAGLIPGLAP